MWFHNTSGSNLACGSGEGKCASGGLFLSGHPRLPKPAQAVQQLKQSCGDADWFAAFEKQAKLGVAWDKVLGATANAATVVKAVVEGFVYGEMVG